MRPKKKQYSLPFLIFGALCVLIAAYYCAAAMREGETIFLWQERMKLVLQEPLRNYYNSYTIKVMLLFGVIYALAALMHITGKRNYLPGREMGSAQYADVKKVHQRLADLSCNPNDPENTVLLREKRVSWKALRDWMEKRRKVKKNEK